MKKRKRINPIEANIEKVVLGGVSVVLLGVIAVQFLLQPNAVKIGNINQAVPPDQIYDGVKNKATELLARMNDSQPDLQAISEQDVKSSFEKLSSSVGQVASRVHLEHFGETAKIGAVAVAENTADASSTTYVIPSLPAPEAIVAATYRATVDPMEWVNNKAIQSYLPSEQPFDIAAVSIEGSISGKDLRASLETDPDGDEGPLRPLPLSWWRGGLELVGIEAERQELDADGNWTNATIIAGLPGQPTLLSEARQSGLRPLDMQGITKDAAAEMRQIIEPDFLPVIAGPEWVPPSERSEDGSMSEDDVKIARLEKQLTKVDAAIGRLEDQLGKVGSGSSSSGSSNQNESGRSGGGRRGGGGGEGGGGGGGSARDPGRQNDQKRQALQVAIEKQNRIRDRVLDQLDALGVNPDEGQNAAASKVVQEKPLPNLLDAEQLPVWVHDITAEPGRVYRYHIRTVVNNPLFGRGPYLADAQQDAAASAVLNGPWSSWSGPITIADPKQYFVISASENDNIGNGPRAAVEVYEFYYGYWRKGAATLEPGDTIHSNAKLPEGLLTWDLGKLAELGGIPASKRQSGRSGGPGFEGGGSPEGGRPGMFNPGNERFRSPEGGGEGGIPSKNRTGQRRGGANQNAEKTEIPEGATELPRNLPIAINALLLDVTSVPGREDAYQVILRGAAGQLLVQRAAASRSGSLYRRVAASAREGLLQGKSGEPEAKDSGNQPTIPSERDYQNDGMEGGGGGGGG